MNRQGQLPKGWQICNLEDFIKLIDYRGRTPVKTTTGIRLITAKNVKLGYLQLEPQEFINPASYNTWMTRGIPNYGDVIFTTEAPLANVAQLDTTEKVAFAQRIIVMQPQLNKINQTFLKYLLLSDSVRRRILENGTGATVQGIKSRLLKKIQLPLPPLPEQKHIVAILDEAFASIASAKVNAEQNLKKAKELFESYLQSVFANKGEGWANKTLNQISENLDNKRVPITQNVRSKGSVPYYGASGIVDYVEDYLFDDDLLLVSEDGANLLARTYPIAFSIKGKTWVNNHAHILKFRNMASQKFVEYYLNSIKLDDYVSGMAQPKLNQKMLNSIIIPFPSLTEQQVIINKLNILSAETKKLGTIYQQKLNDLAELKKSILQKAFNGELKTSIPTPI